MNADPPGVETEELRPECGEEFLIKTPWGEVRCPNGDYVAGGSA